MLLDAITKNMKKRLVADNHVKAISTEQENVLELFNLLDQTLEIWKKLLYRRLQQKINLANLINLYIMEWVLMISEIL